ncbi:MAG TPA: phosphoribosyltransferase family protein [Vicinamibacterales bacterium]|nr:phosphoribosyltransferase family protein [Vicinamibacterales bacterium]
MSRRDEVRLQALKKLQDFEVLMVNGHFDYGNGYHGRVYLNPHQLFRHPSTIWQLAQDLLDVIPSHVLQQTEVVAGPVTGGALLAHTLAGLLDGRRPLTLPRSQFAPFTQEQPGHFVLRPFYARHISGKRVLLADDVRNTGKTFERCAELVRQAGGELVATVEIYDRGESVVDVGVPNFALAAYESARNYTIDSCPMCAQGTPITTW